MYSIPFADGVLHVDCKWNSYDPDSFEIYDMEWEVGITIPKCVWFNLPIHNSQIPVEYHWHNYGYIHEYIFAWMCANEPIEYVEDW